MELGHFMGNSRTSKWSVLVAVFQIILATMHFNTRIAVSGASLTPEITSDDINAAAEKRNWQSLQGSWGKRATADGGNSISNFDINDPNDDDMLLAEHWMPVLVNSNDGSQPVLKYSLVYLTNAATLDRLANGAQADEVQNARSIDTLLDDNDSNANDGIANEKRAWKSLNTAWGKRRNAPQWNKFRGAWGKREPSWNNLKGMWGKRTKDWQKLHGSWGKRSQAILPETN